MSYIYTMEYYSAIKMNEIMPLAKTWMDLEIITKWGKSNRMTNIMWYDLYAESKKMVQMKLFRKQKQTHRFRKQAYVYQRGKMEKKHILRGWGNIYTVLYIK